MALPQTPNRISSWRTPRRSWRGISEPIWRYGTGLADVAAMAAKLAAIRDQGYAVVSPSCRDVQFVAAPVQVASGAVIAAVGAHVRPSQDVDATVGLVKRTASAISAELGAASQP